MNEEIYSKDVIEFVTVATEFCVRAEQVSESQLQDFVPAMLKILPLLYLKAMILMDSVSPADEEAEQLVTEADYDFVRSNIAALLGSHDDYLDVFMEDMKYSDRPIRKTISEDLADIYQDLRNFVAVFRQGYDETMTIALGNLMEQFPHYWGQRIVSTQRALHDVMFQQEIEEDSFPE
ncbi:MAG: DUF5063 domain-containing protein [Bacteroidaceae bacterium]|nr:DUF5063 domain-containing protein [Bacteroidaceae bacterium]